MPIDIIFIAAFGYGFWQGYSRGIIGTVFNILAYVFGITLAFKITPTTTNILERMFNSQNPTMFIAAFIVNLILIMFVLRMAAKSLEGVFQAVYLGFINQILGGVFMGSMMVLVYSVLLWFFVKVQFLNEVTIAESRAYPFLKDLPAEAKVVLTRFKPFAEEVWGTSLNWMDRLERYGEQKTGEGDKARIYELPDDKDGKTIEDDPLEETQPNIRRIKPADEPVIED
jgi:uncharacterized membrane protein required for colicin V production